MAQRTEDEWEERFEGPVQDAGGETVWFPRGASLEAVQALDPLTVWSVIEGDGNENLYLLPGFHAVNLVGYVVAGKPITEAELRSGDWDEVLWVDGDEIVRSPGR